MASYEDDSALFNQNMQRNYGSWLNECYKFWMNIPERSLNAEVGDYKKRGLEVKVEERAFDSDGNELKNWKAVFVKGKA